MASKLNPATLEKLIDHQSVCFLSSVDEEGFPVMRAMLMPRHREGLRVFYLTTNTSSQKVAQYTQNPKAALYFCDKRFFRGVMLRGEVEVLQDSDSRRLVWRKGDEQYYPRGVEDEDYSVLRFTADKGRYYSSYKTKDFAVEE